VTADAASTVAVNIAASVTDYLGLTPGQRYNIVSQHFPLWLLTEPIEFPAHHPTYGWACRVAGCEAILSSTNTRLLCVGHARQYRGTTEVVSLDAFIRDANPGYTSSSGWALVRRPDCRICGSNRESFSGDYCQAHWTRLLRARKRGISDADWRQAEDPLEPWPSRCSIERCVHDGTIHASVDGARHRLCRGHHDQWSARVKSADGKGATRAWDAWLRSAVVQNSVKPPTSRGQLSLAHLPPGLQREVRYALHRHAKTARRTQWRPKVLQAVVDVLADAGVQSLSDPRVEELSGGKRGSAERRIWLDLPFAARSLAVTEEVAWAAGWFDPVIVGAAPFDGTNNDKNRRKIWDLTGVSQRWLRDLLWDHLRDGALKSEGKRPVGQTVHQRIAGVVLLSHTLRQNRDDGGEDPALLGRSDAKAVKDAWDLWHREQIPLPGITAGNSATELCTLTDGTRYVHMNNVKVVLRRSREQGRTPPAMDAFILSLPEYPPPARNPRPRPISYGDFQLLVNPDSIATFQAIDSDDLGLADIWLTHAFQGGRISETLKLRLGCVGLVGSAQPYIWRDISKVHVVDYGMPCHLPVYERLLRRQRVTRAKLRARYTDQLDALDDRGRAQLEASWDRSMPLFPGAQRRNPDLVIEVTQTYFRDQFTEWLHSLGLSGITTHRTRATLATSLLNNGAPAALVRQLLGHFSQEALVHYANYNNDNLTRHLQQVWAAGPGMDKPGTILLRPQDVKTAEASAATARIDLTIVPVEHGLCRYGPVVGGAHCPFGKNCSAGTNGPCEHFVLTGADLAYWERKRDAAYHFAEGAPSDEARDYILSQWHPWEPVLTGLREALDELGLLEEAESLDLRAPVHDYFDPLFSTGWPVAQLDPADRQSPDEPNRAK